LAIAPYDVNTSPQVQAEWDRFLGELRDQYNSFGAIYDDIQTGAVPPSSAVEESTVLAQKLTAQLTAFAAALDENPPLLLQHRSAILAELDTTRQQYQALINQQVTLRSEVTQIEASMQATQQQLSQLQQAGTPANNNPNSQNTLAITDHQRQQQTLINQQQTEQQKRQNILTQIAALDQQKLTLEDKTGTFMEQWQALRTEEQQLLEDTVRQCLKAASIGQDLVELSQTYDQLNFASLNGVIGNILQKSSILNTFGLSALETKADGLLATIKAKSNWQQITDQSINRINNLLLDKTLPNNLENNLNSNANSNLNPNINDQLDTNMELFQLPQ
jgi:chromosome segregation ATPase